MTIMWFTCPPRIQITMTSSIKGRFLQITLYSYYFCKDCDCRALDYSSSTGCPYCVHIFVRHFCWWNRGDGKRAMIVLKHKILQSIVLRRTKKGRAADLALPPKIVSLRQDTLDIKEKDYYTSLYNESRARFNVFFLEADVERVPGRFFWEEVHMMVLVDYVGAGLNIIKLVRNWWGESLGGEGYYLIPRSRTGKKRVLREF